MKVIFLDMDGVILAFKTNRAGVHFGVTKECVEQLNRVIEKTGAVVVMSSTWRLYYELPILQKLFDDNGCIAKIIDKTPSKPQSISSLRCRCERGLEIAAWLKKHPEVTKYAVVDDDINDITPIIKTGVVKVEDAYEGLTAFEADKLISLLE